MDQLLLNPLACLLRKRLNIIADHAFRDRDPQAHLEALKAIFEEIQLEHENLKGKIPPRLEHFLSGCSYDKALAFIEQGPGN
ncbi:MAG: hypothetical protein GY899_18640 [Verrucomicrobiaceae bacterium]|nr:hypothetical protein [Verrucomicrobiaceae bacterium]